LFFFLLPFVLYLLDFFLLSPFFEPTDLKEETTERCSKSAAAVAAATAAAAATL